MINKTNPILHWRLGVAFFARKADGVLLRHEAEPLQRVDVLIGDFGSLPLKILGGHLGFRRAVASQTRARWHQWQRAEQCICVRKIGESWAQGKFCEKEQVSGASEGMNEG